MIASWVQQLGWTKPPVVESKPAPVARNVAPKAPAAPSIDPELIRKGDARSNKATPALRGFAPKL
jgi:hypothetical protein